MQYIKNHFRLFVNPNKFSIVDILLLLFATPSRHFVMNKSILKSILLTIELNFYILSEVSFTFNSLNASLLILNITGFIICIILINPYNFTHWVANIFYVLSFSNTYYFNFYSFNWLSFWHFLVSAFYLFSFDFALTTPDLFNKLLFDLGVIFFC